MPNICLPCDKLKEISVCTETIVIGTVASFNTLYYIYFISLANGFIVRYTATSNGLGVLVLTPVNGFVLATNHLYEIFVNTNQSVSTGENISIGAVTAKCFNVSFVEVKDIVSQTFEIA